jgi:hypothetical protein
VRLSIALCLASLVATTAMAEVPGEDHPLLPRYEGAEIRAYRAPSQDSVIIPTSRVGDEKAAALAKQISGDVTHIDYILTPATATAQVGRYYEGVLRSAGFRTVFSCVGESACGSGMGALIFNSGKVAPTGFADGLFGDRMRVIVAQRGSTWALLHIYEGPDRTTIYEAVVDGAG